MVDLASEFSDYLIFVDESGDHGLISIDPQFPVFSLVFVIIKKSDYLKHVVPAFQTLKMTYWGHDQIVLHERDIRQETGVFKIFQANLQLKNNFMHDLSEIIKIIPFQYVVSVINKKELVTRYSKPYSPYNISLLFCMEQTLEILLQNNQTGKISHIIIEERGKKEDKTLFTTFDYIRNNRTTIGWKSLDFQQIPFEMLFINKKSNSSGLQLADLIARPLALKALRPKQENKAYDILMSKDNGYIKYFP